MELSGLMFGAARRRRVSDAEEWKRSFRQTDDRSVRFFSVTVKRMTGGHRWKHKKNGRVLRGDCKGPCQRKEVNSELNG
jgi:hypothetical protein